MSFQRVECLSPLELPAGPKNLDAVQKNSSSAQNTPVEMKGKSKMTNKQHGCQLGMSAVSSDSHGSNGLDSLASPDQRASKQSLDSLPEYSGPPSGTSSKRASRSVVSPVTSGKGARGEQVTSSLGSAPEVHGGRLHLSRKLLVPALMIVLILATQICLVCIEIAATVDSAVSLWGAHVLIEVAILVNAVLLAQLVRGPAFDKEVVDEKLVANELMQLSLSICSASAESCHNLLLALSPQERRAVLVMAHAVKSRLFTEEVDRSPLTPPSNCSATAPFDAVSPESAHSLEPSHESRVRSRESHGSDAPLFVKSKETLRSRGSSRRNSIHSIASEYANKIFDPQLRKQSIDLTRTQSAPDHFDGVAKGDLESLEEKIRLLQGQNLPDEASPPLSPNAVLSPASSQPGSPFLSPKGSHENMDFLLGSPQYGRRKSSNKSICSDNSAGDFNRKRLQLQQFLSNDSLKSVRSNESVRSAQSGLFSTQQMGSKVSAKVEQKQLFGSNDNQRGGEEAKGSKFNTNGSGQTFSSGGSMTVEVVTKTSYTSDNDHTSAQVREAASEANVQAVGQLTWGKDGSAFHCGEMEKQRRRSGSLAERYDLKEHMMTGDIGDICPSSPPPTDGQHLEAAVVLQNVPHETSLLAQMFSQMVAPLQAEPNTSARQQFNDGASVADTVATEDLLQIAMNSRWDEDRGDPREQKRRPSLPGVVEDEYQEQEENGKSDKAVSDAELVNQSNSITHDCDISFEERQRKFQERKERRKKSRETSTKVTYGAMIRNSFEQNLPDAQEAHDVV